MIDSLTSNPISAPTPEQLQTLEDYERRLESIRNNITLNDAEVVRLKKLVKSLEYTVGQLHNNKEYLEEEIGKLKREKEEAEAWLADRATLAQQAEKKLQEIQIAVKKAKDELARLRSQQGEEQAALRKREAALEEQEKRLQEAEATLTERERVITTRDENSRKYVEQVKAAKKHVQDALQALEA